MHVQAALDRQSRPSAEALGLSMDPFTDGMSDLDTLDLRLEYVAAMMKGVSVCCNLFGRCLSLAKSNYSC